MTTRSRLALPKLDLRALGISELTFSAIVNFAPETTGAVSEAEVSSRVGSVGLPVTQFLNYRPHGRSGANHQISFRIQRFPALDDVAGISHRVFVGYTPEVRKTAFVQKRTVKTMSRLMRPLVGARIHGLTLISGVFRYESSAVTRSWFPLPTVLEAEDEPGVFVVEGIRASRFVSDEKGPPDYWFSLDRFESRYIQLRLNQWADAELGSHEINEKLPDFLETARKLVSLEQD